ncbi:MAG: hypothetical protein KDA78_06910 [Planctomycetaceae bacterium]|nr:hypothetical protein [Planctomycetaceae bacterium]
MSPALVSAAEESNDEIEMAPSVFEELPFLTDVSSDKDEIVVRAQQGRRQSQQVAVELRFMTITDRFFDRIGVDFDFGTTHFMGGTLGKTTSRGVDFSIGGTLPVYREVNGRSIFELGLETELRYSTFNGDRGVVIFDQNDFNAPNVVVDQLDLTVCSFGPTLEVVSSSTGAFPILSDIESSVFGGPGMRDRSSRVQFSPKLMLGSAHASLIPEPMGMMPGAEFLPRMGQPNTSDFIYGYEFELAVGTQLGRRGNSYINFVAAVGSLNTSVITNDSSANSYLRLGFQIQEPIVLLSTVTTAVSVLDGGTVLLGGIRRLREERNTGRAPIQDSVPNASRLFRNAGTGQGSRGDSLLVTPRSIIQD